VTSEKLGSLSVEDLYLLADRMGLDLPPGLERVFVLEELLGALADETEENRGGGSLRVGEMRFSGSEPDAIYAHREAPPTLQRRYNETMVRSLVRDPSWAFAYWDISDAEREKLQDGDSPASLFLRITEAKNEDSRKIFFDIPVSYDDLQWYINLPRPGIRFRIDLCARRPGSRLRVLARSNEIAAPRQTVSARSKPDARSASLLRLSGIEELRIEARSEGNPRRILDDTPGASSAAAAGR
jgi:hypothetical protein